MQVRRPDGRVRFDSGWFKNTILNSGRNVMSTQSGWIDACQVGTGTTFPASVIDRRNETSLESHFAGTTDIVANSDINGQAGTAPYFGWRRRTFRFAAGTVAANLSEVGVGWGTTGSTLISRAQILDPATQNPTTVTPLADELLDVTYELRYYAPAADATGPQVTMDGVNYDTVTRAAEVTSDYWSDSIGNQIGLRDVTLQIAYDGNLGTVTTSPSGSGLSNGTSVSAASYSNNSYEQDFFVNGASTSFNFGGGIRSVLWRTTAGAFQTEFSSNPGGLAIPKSSSYTISLGLNLTWFEHT